MKIAFIGNSLTYNFGIMYLSAVLKKDGHEVDIFINPLEKDLISSVCEFGPQLLGVSVISGDHKWFYSVIKEIKKKIDIKVIIGGPHPTYFPEVIEHEDIDYVCIGEGEDAIVELANKLDKKEDTTSIKNLWIKNGNIIHKNPLGRFIEDLDTIPFPDRSIFLKYEFFRKMTEIPIVTTRGCPWNCNFCYNNSKKTIYKGLGKYVRLRKPIYVIEELKQTFRNIYAAKSVMLWDDIIGINKKWLSDFSELYQKEINLPFFASIRADLIDEESIKMLKNANCNCLSIGLETGDSEIRESVLGKKIDDSIYFRAADLVKKNGIKLRTSNIFFLPGENLDKALKTVEMNIEMGTDFPFAYAFQPYPGTPIYEYSIKKGFIEKGYSIDDLDNLGMSDSPIKSNDYNKIKILHRMFYYLVRSPSLIKICLFLPYNKLFDLFHKLSMLIMYAGYHNIGYLPAFRILLGYQRILKKNNNNL